MGVHQAGHDEQVPSHHHLGTRRRSEVAADRGNAVPLDEDVGTERG